MKVLWVCVLLPCPSRPFPGPNEGFLAGLGNRSADFTATSRGRSAEGDGLRLWKACRILAQPNGRSGFEDALRSSLDWMQARSDTSLPVPRFHSIRSEREL